MLNCPILPHTNMQRNIAKFMKNRCPRREFDCSVMFYDKFHKKDVNR